MTFGEFIKKQREAKSWTQPEAAEKIAIEQSYLSKLENNKATPSSEIFDKLQLEYGFDTTELNNALTAEELKRLTDVKVVKDYILNLNETILLSQRRWLLAGLVMVMIGAFSVSLGYLFKDLKQTSYVYESKGIINKGESLNIFNNLPSSERLSSFIKMGDTSHYEDRPFFERLDYKKIKLKEDRGTFFTDITENKTRRYNRVTLHYTPIKWPHYLGVSFGVMLLIGGFCCFYLRQKWQ